MCRAEMVWAAALSLRTAYSTSPAAKSRRMAVIVDSAPISRAEINPNPPFLAPSSRLGSLRRGVLR